MNVPPAPEESRSLRLKAATRDSHGALDKHIMAGDIFASRSNFSRFLRVQYRFHHSIDGLYAHPAVVALLPDLDSRFERLYGYLNDDVTRRRASVGLALQLAGESAMTASARARLELSRPLVSRGLVVVEEPERPFLTRGLRVPDRVGAHLLGHDASAAGLAGLIDEVGPYWAPVADQLGRAQPRPV